MTLPQNLLMANSVGDKQERHTSFTTNSSVNSSAGSNLNYEATADDIMKEDDIMVVVEDGATIQNSPPQVTLANNIEVCTISCSQDQTAVLDHLALSRF